MKKIMPLVIAAVTCAPAMANDINLAQCQEAPRSQECLSYLEGTVDGALALMNLQQSTPLSTDSISDRALKYRSGKRFKQANDALCLHKAPERDQMVLALDDLAAEGVITSQEELSQALSELLSCQTK